MLVLAGLTLSCLAALAGPSAAQSATSTTRFAAHRGGAALWPENSLLAFKNAIAAINYGEPVVLRSPIAAGRRRRLSSGR